MKKLLTIFTILITTTLTLTSQVKVEKLDSPKKGTSLFSVEFPTYGEILDSTRASVNVSPLKRNPDMDLIAKERCLRMAKILANGNTGLLDDKDDFEKNAHTGCKTEYMENTTCSQSSGVQRSEIETMGCDRVLDVITNSNSPDNAKDINRKYNESFHHKETRTKEDYKEYGTYTIVLFMYTKNPYYDETNPHSFTSEYSVIRLVVNYECFR